MEDREAGTYSTPREAAVSPEEARRARERVGAGVGTLFVSVFVAFVIVAAVALAVRYLV